MFGSPGTPEKSQSIDNSVRPKVCSTPRTTSAQASFLHLLLHCQLLGIPPVTNRVSLRAPAWASSARRALGQSLALRQRCRRSL